MVSTSHLSASRRRLDQQGCTLVDTTCGSVLTVWKNVKRYAQDGFTSPANEVVDFRALWKDGQDRYTIIGYVKNAFDELAYQDFRTGSPSASGVQRQTLKPNFPRTYGVEIQYRF